MHHHGVDDVPIGLARGDLLVIRSKFIVKRDDFGIRPGEKLEKVANDIEISLNVAGAAPSK